MPHVLAYTPPARGHLFPLTPILDALHARGHAVTVRTLADGVGLMRSRGRLRDRAVRPLTAGTLERIVVRELKGVRTRMGLGAVDTTTMFTRPPVLLSLTAEPLE